MQNKYTENRKQKVRKMLESQTPCVCVEYNVGNSKVVQRTRTHLTFTEKNCSCHSFASYLFRNCRGAKNGRIVCEFEDEFCWRLFLLFFAGTYSQSSHLPQVCCAYVFVRVTTETFFVAAAGMQCGSARRCVIIIYYYFI